MEGPRCHFLWKQPYEVVRLPSKRHARPWQCGPLLCKTEAMCGHLSSCPMLQGLEGREASPRCGHASSCASRCWPPCPAILFLLGKRPPPRRGCLSRCAKESKLDRMACPPRLQMTSNEGRDRCGCAAGLQRLAFPKVRGCLVGRSVGRRNCLRCAMARGHRRDNARGLQRRGSRCPIHRLWESFDAIAFTSLRYDHSSCQGRTPWVLGDVRESISKMDCL